MGLRQDANAESHFFLRMNRWLLTQCGATWATPADVQTVGEHHLDVLAPAIRRRIASSTAIEHFGIGSRRQPWGFKDPRSTLLFWLYDRVFPECRIIIVSRHGVDVAESLRVRAHASGQTVRPSYTAPAFGMRQPRANRMQNIVLASDRSRNFELWKRYQETVATLASSIDPHRVHHVQFEQLVDEPEPCLSALSHFVEATIADIGLQRGRAHAYRNSPELVAFAKERQRDLAAFGY